MDFVTPIVTPVVESLLIPVKRHFGFLISSSNKVKDVHDKLTELDGAASDMHAKLVSSTAHRRVVPLRVPDWLEEVQIIKDEMARKIPTGRVGCFNLNMRYKAGRDSANILRRIDRLIKEKAEMVWTNEIIPLGAVSPLRAPTSLAVYEDANQTNDIIESRRLIFKDALKSLDPNNIKTQKIALCGMAGVGKTTMMEEMLKAANDRKMFDYIVKVVVGQNPNLALVQQTVAEQTGETIKETTNDTRAKHLKERFKVRSEEGKKKILVILDDVWEVFNLEDIGLVNPLRNGFKLLLTSREETACFGMGVEASSIFKIEVLKDPEDKNLFWETTGIGSHSDITDLLQIGEDIIKRCGGLPIAIKTIACTLKCIKERDEWNHALFCIQNKDFPVIINIFEFSYKNLKEDDLKETFLLCGLFSEDSNIGIEDLVMYGWGLKLFKNVRSIAKARYRVNTYVNRLIRSNLLIKSDPEGCVKMHDLVRDFILSSFSNVMQASLGNHNINTSQQLKEEESYERILLKCEGMLEVPLDFNHPNLKLLKLMDGHKLLKFPIDFYTRMDKLEVIAYNDMHLPLLPHYSTNLRVLCLRSCSLVDNDVSFIGDLINLEVLNLAYCGIHKLPSKVGKLKRLKLLDLSGCVNLHIDNGVFKNLDQLEELYMGVCEASSIRFSDTNCDELKILSRHLFALELEFFNNKAQPVNVSFENLERFKISIECVLDKRRRLVNSVGDYSFKNTLKLEISSSELRECKINELFRKTEILHMKVNDMSSLEDLLVHPPQNAFCNLNELSISNCESLAYLFTISMANGLTKLEKLFVTSCSVLQFVVNGENSEAGVVKFHKLKFLSLHNLPKLVSLCGHVNVMELPQLMDLDLDGLPNYTSIFPKNNINISLGQPFFNKEVMIPKLEKLTITGMENLKDIWECEITTSEGEVNNIFMLREIKVKDCNGVMNLFPKNPMRLLTYLEELKVRNCGSIKVLFNIELGQNQQLSRCSLRNIEVWRCQSLRDVWRIKGGEDNYFIGGFQDVETIHVFECEKFRNIVTPTTAIFNVKALKDISINDCNEYGERYNELVRNSQEQEINNISKADDNLSTVAFTSHQITHNFHQLRKINLDRVNRVEVVFEIKSPSNRDQIVTTQHQQQPVLPYLEDLRLINMEKLSHVWKCKSWSEFFILHKHQRLSSFQNLTTIHLWRWPSIKYLFSPLIVKLLSNLREVMIWRCDGMEEVSNRDDDDDDDEEMTSSTYANTTATLFPCLHLLKLYNMKNLKHTGVQSRTTTDVSHGQSKVSQVDVVSWSLCQYSREIYISECDALSSGIPYYAAGQTVKLQELTIIRCTSMMEVFESKEITNNNNGGCNSSAKVAISRPAYSIVHKLPYLKILHINDCDCLENIFTFSTLESLKKLEKLTIRHCGAMKVIVREEVREDTSALSKNVVFTNLKSIELDSLPNLAGFFFGVNIDFEWPLLQYVKIEECPQLVVFTSGHSTTPRLNYMHTGLGQHNLECGLNFHQTPSTGLDCISSNHSIPEGRTWSFHNLIQCNIKYSHVDTKIFPYHELQQLEKLETIHIYWCENVEEVFEVALEVTNNESQTGVKFPKLREVNLNSLDHLKCLWKSNQWRKLEFPNLTRLSIDECDSLEHVFTCFMIGCVMQLQELHIQNCKKMKAVVKEEEEDCDAKVSEIIEFPSLKSLKLDKLYSLEGFFLGKEDFTFPSLNALEIRKCPDILVFSGGRSIIPKKTVVETIFGSFNVGEDINSFIMTKKQEGFSF